MNSCLDERLKEVIRRNSRRPTEVDEITSETDLVDDLALDSILIVNLFADLEEEFNITIHAHEITTPILSKYRLLQDYVMGRIAVQTTR
jgi:acyl carrier protein